MSTPASLRVPANGLTHHVLEWPRDQPRGTVLLLHGYMDAAGTWDLVAPALASAGYRVIAPDFRGFGDAPRAPGGSYYYFLDYIHDVADLVEALVPGGAPLSVVGHSMGGTVATIYSGTFPERVTLLAVLEGAGPPDHTHEHAPEQMRRWIESVRAVKSRGERTLSSRDGALARLVANHPRIAGGRAPDPPRLPRARLARRPDDLEGRPLALDAIAGSFLLGDVEGLREACDVPRPFRVGRATRMASAGRGRPRGELPDAGASRDRRCGAHDALDPARGALRALGQVPRDVYARRTAASRSRLNASMFAGAARSHGWKSRRK